MTLTVDAYNLQGFLLGLSLAWAFIIAVKDL
jgi:hypothetical protein